MTWEEKLAHDLEYIADRSPRLYLGVIAETAGAPIPRRARAGLTDVRHVRHLRPRALDGAPSTRVRSRR